MPRDLPAFDVETTPLRRLIDALRGPCPDYDGGCYQHCALDVASRHGLCPSYYEWRRQGHCGPVLYYPFDCCRQMGIEGAEDIFRHSTVYTKDEMADRLEAWAKERGL